MPALPPPLPSKVLGSDGPCAAVTRRVPGERAHPQASTAQPVTGWVQPPSPGPEGLSKLQLMKLKKDRAAADQAAAAAAPATRVAKAEAAMAEAPPGMSKLQAMAWLRRREHKRRALLKVRALIFMTGARGLAAAESNGGVVPRAVLQQDGEDGSDSSKPQVIARLEAKRGNMARRRWMKIRSIVFMLGAVGLQRKVQAADRASKLVPPPGLSAKERIRWRGERKANIKRALLKLRAVIAIAGAAGLRDPNTPPENLSPMEKLKWKAARNQQLEEEERAREDASMRGSDHVEASDSQLQLLEPNTVAFYGESWAPTRSPVPAVLSRVLGVQHSPTDRHLSDSRRRQLSQPELDGVVAAEDNHAVGHLHEGVYGRTMRGLEKTARAVDFSVTQQSYLPTDGPGSAYHYDATSAFLVSRERPRPTPSRSFSQPSRSQPQPWLSRATARSPSRPAARSPVKQYHRQQHRVPSPGRSPSVRSSMRTQSTYQLSASAVRGADGGTYQTGLGMVSERIANLQMERAVLATRNDFEALSRLTQVETELRATHAAIKLAQEQLGRSRSRSRSRSSRSRR